MQSPCIRAEEHWTPEPSNFCSYCAYDGNGCSLTETAVNEDEDWEDEDNDVGVNDEPD